MNWDHFRAFLWLRWRLRVNQLRRGGIVNTILVAILGVGVVLLGLGLFGGSIAFGALAFAERSPPPHVLMYIWDGIVAAFLFFWATALLADLQRSEPLTIGKILHLPVSPGNAFVINYLSSLFSITLYLFLSVSVGFTIGLTVSRGPWLLLIFPVLAAFFLMMTALTYQFQGWLAALMSNPRRRRTVVVFTTIGFILVFQVPNLLNIMNSRQGTRVTGPQQRLAERQEELRKAFEANQVTPEDFVRKSNELMATFNEETQQDKADRAHSIEDTVHLVNKVFPPGWLPLAVDGLDDGRPLVALLAMAAFGLVGSASLWRAYRTTLRLYTGQYTGGSAAAPADVAPVPLSGKPRFMEKRLPLVSEQAATIALGSFLSLLRAPESKMMLLPPVIMVIIFGSLLLSGSLKVPDDARPLLAFAGMATCLLGMGQAAGNQFGFDRAGFRVYVLCPAPRREVILGKNLALAPLPAAWGLVVLVIVQVFYPMRFDHLLACVFQMAGMVLLYLSMMNFLSLLAPVYIAPGSMQPTNIKLIPVLIQLAFLFTFPMVLGLVMLPLGVEVLLDKVAGIRGLPVNLGLTLLVSAVVVVVYLLCVHFQGFILHNREKHILTVVTSKD